MDEKFEHLLSDVIACARTAGEKILSIYHREFGVTQKDNNTPLTEADMAAHRYIVDFLQQLTPEIPILSEESSDIPWQQRQQWQRYWLVDPLDGTKEFIKRNGEFTVNIALIDQHRPILGVVYAPDKQCLYYAAEGIGAFQQQNNQAVQPITVSPHQSHQAWQVVASRSHPSPALSELLDHLEQYELLSMGSSLKLCLVANGQANLYPRLGLTSEWDTAAAQCVVEQAGGLVVTLEGQALSYNQKDSLLNPYFIVAASKLDLAACHPLIENV